MIDELFYGNVLQIINNKCINREPSGHPWLWSPTTISYIFIDASGWVISDVSFGFMEGFRVLQHQTSHPNDPVGIDVTPTPILAANLCIHTRKKMTTEMALYIILQQPIRAKLYWWLLNLSFKNWEATLLLLFGHNDVVIRLFVHSGMYFFLL